MTGQSAQLGLARLGSVTLGRRQRSLDRDLDISSLPLENFGEGTSILCKSKFDFEEGSLAAGRGHGRTDGRTKFSGPVRYRNFKTLI